MNKFTAAAALAASMLSFTKPAFAEPQPPLPSPVSSFTAGTVHADVYGVPGKQAIIFIPGLTCGPWEWAREIGVFSKTNTVYALTLPGFDGRPAVQGPPVKTFSSDFWTMLQAHHIDRPIVIGHSLGGTLAIALAEEHSSKLRGVIAIDGLPVFPGMENLTAAGRAQSAQRMASMIASASTPEQFEAAQRTYSLPYLVTSKSDVDAIAKLAARSVPSAVADWASADVQLDLRGDLHNIRVPLLEIAPYDPAIEPQIANAGAKQTYYAGLLSADPTAKVTVIERSRHFIMYDQPAALDAKLMSFVGSLP